METYGKGKKTKQTNTISDISTSGKWNGKLWPRLGRLLPSVRLTGKGELRRIGRRVQGKLPASRGRKNSGNGGLELGYRVGKYCGYGGVSRLCLAVLIL